MHESGYPYYESEVRGFVPSTYIVFFIHVGRSRMFVRLLCVIVCGCHVCLRLYSHLLLWALAHNHSKKDPEQDPELLFCVLALNTCSGRSHQQVLKK